MPGRWFESAVPPPRFDGFVHRLPLAHTAASPSNAMSELLLDVKNKDSWSRIARGE